MPEMPNSTSANHAQSRGSSRQTTSIEDAAARLGIGRSLAYQLARRGEFPVPVIRAGRRFVVPLAALDRALGLDATNSREPVAA